MSRPFPTVRQLRAATSNAQRLYVKAGPGAGKTFLAAEAFGHSRFYRHYGDRRGVVATTFARSARRELHRRVWRRWGRAASGFPNAVCTLDELHRRALRHLVGQGLLKWPGGGPLPEMVHDRWSTDAGATRAPGKKPRYYAWLKDGEIVEARFTIESRDPRAPRPAFVDDHAFLTALSDSCTHVDIRNVLDAASQARSRPELEQEVVDLLRRTMCHLIVDEAFDLNGLDIWLLQCAGRADIPLTLIGDPWQSLYEFRQSQPRLVRRFIHRGAFTQVEVPGEHRFKTDEMRELAKALFDGDKFRVQRPDAADEFDVALAHDWADLWAETRYPILPAEPPGRLDGSLLTSCLILLLDAFIADRFERDGARAEAAAERHGLSAAQARERLRPELERIAVGAAVPDDVWDMLEGLFRPASARSWKRPGKVAQDCMKRLIELVSDIRPVIGLSVHQAKGLEWDRVLLIDRELLVSGIRGNRLNQEKEAHRKTYVALTRARRLVRVLDPQTPRAYGVPPVPIEHPRLQ